MYSKNELINLYSKTDFVTFVGNSAIRMKVNKTSVKLDKLIQSNHKRTAAFITAWNPKSQTTSARENLRRNRRLLEDLKKLTSVIFIGQGRDKNHQFFEDSFLAVGLSRLSAIELARKYEQNAIVFYSVNSSAKLVWTGN